MNIFDGEKKAQELGAKEPNTMGTAWTWARHFPSKAKAQEFVTWLEANNFDYQGIYLNADGTADVRYREER